MAGAALAWAVSVAAAGAQESRDRADTPAVEAPRAEVFTIHRDAKMRKLLDAAQSFVAEEQWDDAAAVLLNLVQRAEDTLLEVAAKDKDGREVKKLVSARAEAQRLLDTMPAKGREAYQTRAKEKSAKALTEAKKAGTPDGWSDVLRNYPRTPAAAEAAELLAAHHLKEGSPELASLYLDRVLRGSWDAPSPSLLYRAAAIQRQRGRAEAAAALEKQLFDRLGKDRLRIDGKELTADEAREALKAIKAAERKPSADWPLFRGDARRDEQSRGDVPFLDEQTKRWSHPTARQEQTKTWVAQAVKFQEEQQRAAVLPAFFPIAAKELVFFRSYFGVHAANLRNGKLLWEQDSDYSVDNLVNPQRSGGKLKHLQQWLPMYQRAGHLHAVYENSALGTLSTDGERVYLVDDLAVPPHPLFLMNVMWGAAPNYGALTDAIKSNRLMAMHADAGKRMWQAGGVGEKAGTLADSYFLGAPLPLEGRLYALNERASALQLVCLNAKDGKPIWMQPLGQVRDPLPRDPFRRLQAANLAYADGILLCPTNTGAVFGVDLMTRGVAWVYSYAPPEKAPPAPPARRVIVPPAQALAGSPLPDWRYSTPCIHDGKVVFTAPDGADIHCLNLRDGSRVWTARRQGDLYLAGVFAGKVILVANGSCRALTLADGKPLWNVETGTPSGLGVCIDNTYLLPLRRRPGSDRPEICVVDLTKGEVRSHVRSRRGEVVGNLLCHDGRVISQTVDGIVAYPELRVKREESELLLKNNPRSVVGLIERAELRFAAADARGAAEDLATALDEKPDAELRAKAQERLFEVLTVLLRRDFAAGEKYLPRYRDSCAVAIPDNATAEKRRDLELQQKQREAGYFALVASGREQQGKLEEALAHYLDFSKVANASTLLSLPDEPRLQASPSIWAAGRIAVMTARATPEKRKALEAAIAERWKTARAGTMDDVRNFVAVFGPVSMPGDEARLELATRLIENKAWLEAEMHLQLLHKAEPKLAARAVDLLATIAVWKDRLDDAAHWYRILGSDFDKVVVRDGKTGGDLLRAITVDKRFLTFLDGNPDPWKDVKFAVREEFGQFQQIHTRYAFEREGEPLPSLLAKRLSYNMTRSELALADLRTGEDPWTQGLRRQPQQGLQYLTWNHYHPNAAPTRRFPYQLRGHVAVLPLGMRVYGLDLLESRLLWDEGLGDDNLPITGLEPRPRGGLQAVYPDGRKEAIGGAHFVSVDRVVMLSHRGLTGVDPLTGTVQWRRDGVPTSATIFSDGDHVYVIDVPDDGRVGKGMALRVRDGAAVPIPDFSGVFPDHTRIVGRHLLLEQKGDKEEVILRLYDVHTGKDVWQQTYPKGTIVLRSEEPDLAGVIEPENEGKLTVFDLHTKKERLTSKLDKKALEGAQRATLLGDRDRLYVAIDRAVDAKRNPWGGPWPNLVNGSRGVAINGWLYALPRNADSGAKRWWCEMEDQVLVLDELQSTPILICTSRSQQLIKGGVYQVVATMAIDKRTGKVLYNKKLQNNNTNFHTLRVISKKGVIELISYNMKIEFYPK
jgi:outer membrane protein assembly factor BamB